MLWNFSFAQCRERGFPFALIYRWMKKTYMDSSENEFRQGIQNGHMSNSIPSLFLFPCLSSVLSVYLGLPVKCVFACMWLYDMWVYAQATLTEKLQNSCWQCLGLRYMQTQNFGCHNFICTQWLNMQLNLAPAWSFLLPFSSSLFFVCPREATVGLDCAKLASWWVGEAVCCPHQPSWL